MKNSFLIFGFILITNFGFAKENLNQSLLVEIFGDLDKDKSNEKVIVKELNQKDKSGRVRILEIFKKINDKWKLIGSSKTAILGSEDGGMMGDPFNKENIFIKNGILIINHDGGSSWKWGTTHKYRFQKNKFVLIGYSTQYGKLCEYWANFDCNLLTGKIIYNKEFESCDDNGEQKTIKTVNEIFYNKITNLPTIETINTIEIKIRSPKYKEELTF